MHMAAYGQQRLEKGCYVKGCPLMSKHGGHLPRKISKIYSLFQRRGGSIYCTVTGGRRYSGDLLQEGLRHSMQTAKAEEIFK